MAASSEGDVERQAGGVTFAMALVMQISFNATSSNLLMPWTYATLGYVLGPVLMVLFFGVTLHVQRQLNAAHLAQPPGTAPTLSALMLSISGPRLAACAKTIQTLNLVLFLPVCLSYSAASLQYVVNAPKGSAADCNAYYCLLVSIPVLLLTQLVRKFGHSTGILAGFSVAGIFVQSALIMYSVLANSARYPSDAQPVVGFGDRARMAGTYTWFNVVSSLGNFLYVFVPVFINAELVTEMAEPRQINGMLLLAACTVCCIYISVGLAGALSWGISAQDPINLQLPYDWAGIIVNLLVVYSVGLDYLISAIITTGTLQAWADPAFDRADFSRKACAKWLLYSLPVNLQAVLVVCLIPELQTLVGILTSLTVTSGQWMVPALGGIMWRRSGGEKRAEADCSTVCDRDTDGSAVSSSEEDDPDDENDGDEDSQDEAVGGGEGRLWLTAAAGFAAFLALFAASAYLVATTDYASGNFFCDVVNAA